MVSLLRAATDADHREVDDRFSEFDLTDAGDYGRFLQAHARVLPALEDALALDGTLPPWRRRSDLLASDLAAMGLAQPRPMAAAPPRSSAEAFGTQYVVQGSRLGGRLLARRVGPGLPRAYLSAAHAPGEWRDFLEHLAVATGDPTSRDAAVTAARRTFSAYRDAADAMRVATGRGRAPGT